VRHTPGWQAGVAARLPYSCWHLCTGGWSLRGDVRGTCPRSPCTVPAMCADVRHPRRRHSPLLRCRPLAGRSCRGASLLFWPVIPAVVSIVVSRVVVGVGAPHAEEPPPAGGGGSSADPR